MDGVIKVSCEANEPCAWAQHKMIAVIGVIVAFALYQASLLATEAFTSNQHLSLACQHTSAGCCAFTGGWRGSVFTSSDSTLMCTSEQLYALMTWTARWWSKDDRPAEDRDARARRRDAPYPWTSRLEGLMNGISVFVCKCEGTCSQMSLSTDDFHLVVLYDCSCASSACEIFENDKQKALCELHLRALTYSWLQIRLKIMREDRDSEGHMVDEVRIQAHQHPQYNNHEFRLGRVYHSRNVGFT